MLDSGRGCHERAALELIVSRMGDLLRSKVGFWKGDISDLNFQLPTWSLGMTTYPLASFNLGLADHPPQSCMCFVNNNQY